MESENGTVTARKQKHAQNPTTIKHFCKEKAIFNETQSDSDTVL